MNKKIIHILLILVLILTSCGSGKSEIETEDLNQRENTKLNNEIITESELNKDKVQKIDNEVPRPGGEIRVPLITSLEIDPFRPTNSSIYYFSKLIYNSLFRYNDDGELEGDIVENFSISPDGTILSLTIRDDVYFHDGKKLDTKDILDTFNYIKSFGIDSPYYNKFRYSVGYNNAFSDITFLNMVIFDERNIDLYFDNSYKDTLEMLTFPILESSEIKLKEENPEYKFKNIGTGAYKYSSIEDGRFITLERNDEYYGKIPYIEKVIGKLYSNTYYPEIGFETNQVDILNKENKDFSRLESKKNYRSYGYVSNEMDFLIFNNSKDKFKGEDGKKLKKAIASSINKKRIIDRIFLGNAVETSIPISFNTLGQYDLKSDTYYNADNARNILNELGYNQLDSRGIYKNSNGESIKIEIFTNQNDSQKNVISEFIVEDLNTVGIDARVKTTPDNINLNDKTVLNQNLKRGDYDIALISVNLTDISDLGLLVHTNANGAGLNYSSYSNYTLDELLTSIKLTQSNEEIRENYLKIINILSEDMPILPLYYKKKELLINDNIYGDLNPINSDIYRNFNNLYTVSE